MDFHEGTEVLHVFAHRAPGGGIGRDGRADGDPAILGDLARHIADAPNVEVAVLLGEAQLAAEVLAHDVAIQQRNGAAAHFHQLDHEGIRDGGFAGSREPREEYGETLLAARRTGPAQFPDHFGKGEPLGDLQPFLQATAQFRAGDVEDGDIVAILDLVRGFVLGAFLHIDHVFEIDHFDAHFLLMLAEEVLRIIGAIEIFPGGVLAGPGVVAPHDEMGASVVLAD